MKKKMGYLLVIVALIGFISCNDAEKAANEASELAKAAKQLPPPWPNLELPIGDETITVPSPMPKSGDETTSDLPEVNATRNAYFGDLHVHTTYSFDAFAFGTLATPYDAYRYAKGEAIKHPAGFDLQLREPLDFYAVADHAEFLGVVPAAADPGTDIAKLEMYQPLHDMNIRKKFNIMKYFPKTIQRIFEGLGIVKRGRAFATFIPNTSHGLQDDVLDKEMINDIIRSAWVDIIKAAEKFNDPGKFTTFIAYEYTTMTDGFGNLHRNVIFKRGNKFPAIPFSRNHSQNPEDLWDWMDNLREKDIESLAIPHNSNGSNGQMFKLTDWAGNPINDYYSDQRMRNEPLVEITQIKGCSDTHPALSPNDEWADFEIMPYLVGPMVPSDPPGSYVRNALQRGLAIEDKADANPYKFGFIGSSDTHTAATSEDESNYFGKVGLLDAKAYQRGSEPISKTEAWLYRKAGAEAFMGERNGKDYLITMNETFGTAGLAAVWAEENTREAIYNALRRKETFATTGPRIRVRFFAGFDFDESMINSRDMVSKAYTNGVTMGGDLLNRSGTAPRFLVWAMRDPKTAALQRVQIIKGWIEEGTPKEKTYDVACSDGLEVDPATQRCPDNGAKVNISDCSITEDTGDTELKALWRDPDFDAGQRAFYYVRVLENPTCRWSTWDAVRAGVEPRPDLKKTIQERAWSSPIWYVP